jgi:hypothetical protein
VAGAAVAEEAEAEAAAEEEAEAAAEEEAEAAAEEEAEAAAEAEAEAAAEAAAAAAAAAAAFHETRREMRSATRPWSSEGPPRIGSSQLQASSLLWPASRSAPTAGQPGEGSMWTPRPGRRILARPPAALQERAIRSTAPAPRARDSRTPQQR